MDAKYFAKVKREEPWLMHLKDTWFPHPRFLAIDFYRAWGNRRDEPWLDGFVQDEQKVRVWVYSTHNGIEKIRQVKGCVGQGLCRAIFETVSTGDSIERIAYHWLPGVHKDTPDFEHIIVLKPPKSGPFSKEQNLNHVIGNLLGVGRS
jgi:hypothetical protein